MSDLNAEIKEAIDVFDLPRARELLRDAMKAPNAETYYLASKVALDDEQKTEFLEKAVALDPFHEKARAALKQSKTQPEPVAEKSTPAPQVVSTPPPQAASTQPQGALPQHGATVTATVKDDAEDTQLYILPIETSVVRTSIRKGAEVILVERDDYADFFRVLYQSPAGLVDGWMAAASLDNTNVNGQAINPLDLPITEFAGYKRDDVRQLIELKKSYKGKEKRLEELQKLRNNNLSGEQNYYIIWVGAAVALCAAALSSSEVIAGIILISAFGVTVWKTLKDKKQFEDSAEYKELLQLEPVKADLELRVQNRRKYINRLEVVQRNMRTEYEMMRDDQRRDMLMSAAINVGSTILTGGASAVINRVLPANETITHEIKYKRDDK